MTKFAEKECGDCHGYFPANQMSKVSDKTLAGQSQRPTRTKGADGAYHQGNTQTIDYYRFEKKLICSKCSTRRSRNFLSKWFIILLLVATAGVYQHFDHKSSTSPNVPDNTIASNSGTQEEPKAVAAAVPSISQGSETAPQTDIRPSPAATDEVHQSAAISATNNSGNTPTIIQSSDNSSAVDSAILSATTKALNSGNAERWKASGESGYVVVSTAQASGDKNCRNVYATFIHGGAQTQSASHRWCQSNMGGDWVAD